MTHLGPGLLACSAPQHGTVAIFELFLPVKGGVFAACCTGSTDTAVAAKHSQVSCQTLRLKAMLHFSKGLCCGPWTLFILVCITPTPFASPNQSPSSLRWTGMADGASSATGQAYGATWCSSAPGHKVVLTLGQRGDFCRRFWVVGEQLLYLGHSSIIFSFGKRRALWELWLSLPGGFPLLMRMEALRHAGPCGQLGHPAWRNGTS